MSTVVSAAKNAVLMTVLFFVGFALIGAIANLVADAFFESQRPWSEILLGVGTVSLVGGTGFFCIGLLAGFDKGMNSNG